MKDIQTRQIKENLTNVEKHFGEMCHVFAAYTRKTARLRDKADILIREIGTYADTETPNLKRGMKQFVDHLAMVQDYRQAEVERLEAKVIEPLKCYGDVVRIKREDLKTTKSARSREAQQMARLEKIRQKHPSDRQIVAESELQRATIDATRTTKQFEETIDDFGRQKIRDIKKIFGDFVKVEMSFHAKALELYTLAFQSIQSVDEEEDMEVFRSLLHPPDYPADYLPDYSSHLDIRANTKTSLDQTGSFMSTSGTLQQYGAYHQQATREVEDDEKNNDENDNDDDDESDDDSEEDEEEEEEDAE